MGFIRDLVHEFVTTCASNPDAQSTLYAIFYGSITAIILIIIESIIEYFITSDRRLKK